MNMTIDELKNYPMPRVIPLPKWSKAAENSVICLDGSWKVTDKKDGAVQQVQVPFDMGILHKKGLSQHYSYERKIQLPKREENSRIVLKFQGINGLPQSMWMENRWHIMKTDLLHGMWTLRRKYVENRRFLLLLMWMKKQILSVPIAMEECFTAVGCMYCRKLM